MFRDDANLAFLLVHVDANMLHGCGASAYHALLGGVAELLPLLLLWPATAHAPGVQQETPEMRAARSKVEQKLKELADAARQVESERKAAGARTPRPAPASVPQPPDESAETKKAAGCYCMCYKKGVGPYPAGRKESAAVCWAECKGKHFTGYQCGGAVIWP